MNEDRHRDKESYIGSPGASHEDDFVDPTIENRMTPEGRNYMRRVLGGMSLKVQVFDGHNANDTDPKKPERELLLESVGFYETSEMAYMHRRIMRAYDLDKDANLKADIIEYQAAGEEYVSSMVGQDYVNGQIGLVVASATIYKYIDKTLAYVENISDARLYAENSGMNHSADVLGKLLSKEVSERLAVYGDDFGFDEATLEDIADLPYEDALEVSYGYLVQSGLDAEEILANFIRPCDE